MTRSLVMATLGLFPLCLGCGKACSGIGWFDGARITLHLLPMPDVAAPETLNGCRQPDCVTATLPAVPDDEGRLATVEFSSADVTGLLRKQPNGARLLTIDWVADDLSAHRNSDRFDITITDATGAVTGSLAEQVTYSRDMPAGDGCGERWWTQVSD